MKNITASIFTITFLLNGCSSYKISKGIKMESIKGIPFYTQKELTKQETVRTRKWLDITFKLKVSENGKATPERGQSFKLKGIIKKEYSDDLLTIAKMVENRLNEVNFSSVKNLVVEELNNKNMFISDSDFISESSSDFNNLKHLTESLISNTFESIVAVDYDTKYYFNTRIYPFSKNDSSITISNKGTLTDAKNNVDTTALKDLIPLNDLLLDKLNLNTESEPPPPTEDTGSTIKTIFPGRQIKLTFKLEMTTKIDGYRYVLTKYYSKKITDVNKPPLIIGKTSFSISRSKLDDIKSKKEELENEKSYKFSGAITPPKT